MRREREKEKEREIDTDPCVEFFKIRARTTIIRVITGMNIHDRTSAQQERERNRERDSRGGKQYLHCEFSSTPSKIDRREISRQDAAQEERSIIRYTRFR